MYDLISWSQCTLKNLPFNYRNKQQVTANDYKARKHRTQMTKTEQHAPSALCTGGGYQRQAHALSCPSHPATSEAERRRGAISLELGMRGKVIIAIKLEKLSFHLYKRWTFPASDEDPCARLGNNSAKLHTQNWTVHRKVSWSSLHGRLGPLHASISHTFCVSCSTEFRKLIF